jgi:putative tricarboxylic transport membrane protein
MKTSDIGSSIFFVAMGVFLAWHSVKLSVGSPRVPGPGFFPLCLSLLLIFIAAIIFFQGLKKKSDPPEIGLRRSRVAIVLGAIILYAFVMESVGYLISTFLLILLLLRIMVKKAWWYGLGVAGAVTLVSYLLFRVWLQVLLPSGLLGF